MNVKVLGAFLIEWAVCGLVGYGLVSLLLPRRWDRERFLLMPVFGAGGIILLSSFLSYAGAGMRVAAPLVTVLGAIVSAGMYLSNRRSSRVVRGWPEAIYTNLLGFAAGGAALAGPLLYNAWNPYHDAFTYVSIADYLLQHSYFPFADPGAHQPVFTQILLYQRLGLRMGSNFLLAFFAALFGREYSFDVYLPTVALGLWLAVPAFWTLCRRGLFLSPLACRLASAFYAFHFSVPVANALSGFMPQTWGMVFLFVFLPLFLRSTTHIERNRVLISAGVMGALLLFSYTEILPFALVAAGMSFLYRLAFGRLRLKDAILSFLGIGLITVILTPVAAGKLPTTMAIQISAVVGWDVKYNPWDYLSMLAGYRSFFQGEASPFFLFLSIMTAALIFFALLAGSRRTRRQVVPLLLIFLLALAWFTIFVANPWNLNERGQPWSTYKIMTYIFFLFAALYGTGASLLWEKKGWFRLGAAGLIGVLIFTFPITAFKAAGSNAAPMRAFTGVRENPIAEYKRIRQVLSDLPPQTPVSLIFPPEAQKHRQMTAYFLRRPVIANWMDDGYIWPHLSPAYRSLAIDLSFPLLTYRPFDPKRTVANLLYERTPTVLILLGGGWHGWEHDLQGWWRWLESKGEILITLPKPSTVRLQGEIAIVGAPQRILTIQVEGRPEVSVQRTFGERWFTPFSPIELDLPSGTNKIFLSADGPVARMGQDPRNVRIGVRNLSFGTLSK